MNLMEMLNGSAVFTASCKTQFHLFLLIICSMLGDDSESMLSLQGTCASIEFTEHKAQG